jgi:hypothetical protein
MTELSFVLGCGNEPPFIGRLPAGMASFGPRTMARGPNKDTLSELNYMPTLSRFVLLDGNLLP